MTTKRFKRYWAMTPHGLGLVINEIGPSQTCVVQINSEVIHYRFQNIRPATFSEFCWRDDGFAGTHYGLFFAAMSFCILLLVYGIVGSFPELWGRITCILAGPVIMGTWVGATWLNFKRYVV